MTTALANDRLKQRFEKWDADGSGSLERSDFEQEAKAVARNFGTDINSPEGQQVRKAYNDLYDFQARKAGVPQNGQISLSQFVAVNEQVMQQGGEADFDRMMRPIVKALINLCDDNHDGMINQSEYAKWLKAVGVDASTARSTFSQIDTDGDGELSEDELIAAVRQFHFGKLDVPLLGR
jgi:Ca2+-binding EF-hand superfamily protein